MNILLVEPFLTGSHEAWATEYARHSSHTVKVLGHAGQHWKWRMHGAAVSLSERLLASEFRPDVVLASDMLDLGVFLALSRKRLAGVPVAVYFHENQLTYPWSQTDKDPELRRDRHYAFINYTSALAADRVLFNSDFHKQSFLAALPRFLKAFPDHQSLGSIQEIREKSEVLYLGADLKRFDAFRKEKEKGRPPLVLWNHRWEYDKAPDPFFQALFRLKEEGIDFRLVVFGAGFKRQPGIFHEARRRLNGRIDYFGYEANFSRYAHWLWQADVIPITSKHDFFGISLVQALYCGCYPILPKQLVYPEHIPESLHTEHLYQDLEEFYHKLRVYLQFPMKVDPKIKTRVEDYDWSIMAGKYDAYFSSMVEKNQVV